MADAETMPPTFFSLTDLARAPLELEAGRIIVSAWEKGGRKLSPEALHFGVVQAGEAALAVGGQRYVLPSEHYFRTFGSGKIRGGSGLLISIPGAAARSLKIGDLPKIGYLEYKPGGRMSAICPPDVKGDPNLNMLEMDPSIRDQHDHFHPSIRVNIIIEGSVECFTHDAPPKELKVGEIIVLHAKQHHKFVAGERGMRFVAFHPDSNFGPTKNDNPMLNNTFYE